MTELEELRRRWAARDDRYRARRHLLSDKEIRATRAAREWELDRLTLSREMRAREEFRLRKWEP